MVVCDVSRRRRRRGGRAPRARSRRSRGRAPARAASPRPRGSRASARRTPAPAACSWRSISRATTRSSRSSLAALELDECDVEPPSRVGLGALDPLGDRRLPRLQPLADLVDRPSPLDRLRLELVERLGHGDPGRPLELVTQPLHGAPLLVASSTRARRPPPRSAARPRRSRAADAPPARRACASRWRLGSLHVVDERLQPLVERAARRPRSRRPAPARSARSLLGATARRSSARRRSSSASWESVSARSRASTRRISSTCGLRLRRRRPAFSSVARRLDELVGSRRARGRAGGARARAPPRRPRRRAPTARIQTPGGHMLDSATAQRRREHDGRRGEQAQRRLGAGDEPRPARAGSRSRTRSPPEPADGRRETPLREREQRRPGRGDDAPGADGPGAGDVAGQRPGRRPRRARSRGRCGTGRRTTRGCRRGRARRRPPTSTRINGSKATRRRSRSRRRARPRRPRGRRARVTGSPSAAAGRRARRARGRRHPSRARTRALSAPVGPRRRRREAAADHDVREMPGRVRAGATASRSRASRPARARRRPALTPRRHPTSRGRRRATAAAAERRRSRPSRQRVELGARAASAAWKSRIEPPRNAPTSCQPGEISRPADGQPDPDVGLPGGSPEAPRQPELEHRDRPAGPDDARELAQASPPGRRRSAGGT